MSKHLDFAAIGRWMHNEMAWGEPTPEKYEELMRAAFEQGPLSALADCERRLETLQEAVLDVLIDWGEGKATPEDVRKRLRKAVGRVE